MRFATVTPVYNSANFLRPFLEQISIFDENIILYGNEPFDAYLAAGLVQKERDNSLEILSEFPKLHIVKHDIKSYCGDLFNLAISEAKKLNCDAIIKFDPDMFLEKESMDIFLEKVTSKPFEAWTLNMRDYTMVYEEDLEHGVPQSLWNVGGEPFVIKTDKQFIQDGDNIKVNCHEEMMEWPGFVIHHLSGFKRHIVAEVEKMPNFPGWTPAPAEIKEKFHA